MKTSINFSALTKGQLISKVQSANKSINEGMYIIGKCGLEATTRLKLKRKDFASECGISESMLSKAIASVKYFDEVGGSDFADFQYSKLAIASRKPELFKGIIDSKGVSGLVSLSGANIESIGNGSATFKGFDKKTDKPILATKSEDKKTVKGEKSEDDKVLVTDEKGVKYMIPSSILEKYKVEE